MHGHPTLGVKSGKPRLSSRPGPKIGKLSEEYLGIRNRQMDLKAKKAAMELAVQRGELVSRALVAKQSAFLVDQSEAANPRRSGQPLPKNGERGRCDPSKTHPAGSNAFTLERVKGLASSCNRSQLVEDFGGWRREVKDFRDWRTYLRLHFSAQHAGSLNVSEQV
jgi:hypothetical protein